MPVFVGLRPLSLLPPSQWRRTARRNFRSGKTPDACEILSRSQVEDALKVPVRPGVRRLRTGTVASCSFAGERGGEVAILVRQVADPNWASEQIERMNRGVRLGTYREVQGLAERSFLRTTHRASAVLCVFGTGYYLQVSVFQLEGIPQMPTSLERLAKRSVECLRRVSRLRPQLTSPPACDDGPAGEAI